MRPDLVLASWLRTRRAMRLSPERLAAHRAVLWRRLQGALARTPALARHAGRPLAEFPIVEIADLRADYGAWNSLGMTDRELRGLADAAEAGRSAGRFSGGWSSGSAGGERGLFLAGPGERADYIGQSLARLLPVRALLKRQRLALHLRASNALYSDVGRARFAFAHFSLEESPTKTIEGLRAFDPTILIAPPHRLIAFAETGMRLPSLRRLFSGSEPISAAERSFVAERLGLPPRVIYQATEGFLGAECSEGRLHLNDHALELELEPVASTDGFRPIITDLRRASQPIVRVRGDDYLELDPRPCPCGFGGRVIRLPQGRVGHIWRFEGCAVTPPQVVDLVEAAIGATMRWQAEADGQRIVLRVARECPSAWAQRAAEALRRAVPIPLSVEIERGLAPWSGPKRRKVIGHG